MGYTGEHSIMAMKWIVYRIARALNKEAYYPGQTH